MIYLDEQKIKEGVDRDSRKLAVTDKKCRKLFLEQGIGGQWGTFFKKQSGALCRIKSYCLPMRDEKCDALSDLEKFAKQRGFEAGWK